MKGDLSKRPDTKTIRRLNWSGVLHQQGKVLLDSDWNEQTGITLNWQDQAGQDIIGADVAAIPAQESRNFKILEDSIILRPEGLIFRITPGRIWADGILLYLENEVILELERFRDRIRSGRFNEIRESMRRRVRANELEELVVNRSEIRDTWSRLDATIASGTVEKLDELSGHLLEKYREEVNTINIKRTALEHPHSPGQDSNLYAILLEVWREAINGFQIPEILLEPALGGPDTTERYQTTYAFRYLRLPENEDGGKISCTDVSKIIKKIQGKKKGKLTVSFESVETVDEECPLEGWSGYTGLEHHLYRIEVAETDGADPKFKWSNCNGGLVGRGDKDGDIIKITSNLKAIIDSGYQNFYMEIVQYNRDYGFWDTTFGATVQLTEDNDLQVLYPYLDKEPDNDNVFFRLWNDILDVVDEKITLEYGICLVFDITNWNNMRSGDFWTFPVRAMEKFRETNSEFNVLPNMSEPYGIDYHLVPLALATRIGNTWELTDCRVPFRPLTNQMNCRTFTVGRGGHFRKASEALQALSAYEDGGEIRLLPGLHRMNLDIQIDNIRITGCGTSTRVVPENNGKYVFHVKNADNTLIANMKIHHPSKSAIRISYSKKVIIEKNSIQGGIEIGGGSEKISIRDNKISAESGHGITLGNGMDEIRTQKMNAFAFLYNIKIERNEIFDTGLSGIGTAFFFSSFEDLRNKETILDNKLSEAFYWYGNIIDDLVVSENYIHDCLKSITEISQLYDNKLIYEEVTSRGIGLGGISLLCSYELTVRNNVIEDYGSVPACGLYLKCGESVEITDNHIVNSADITEKVKLESPNVLQYPSGGIVIEITGAGASIPEQKGRGASSLTYIDTPAARILDNIVHINYGQALYLVAFGPVSITNNSFKTQYCSIPTIIEDIRPIVQILRRLPAERLTKLLAGSVFLLNLGGFGNFLNSLYCHPLPGFDVETISDILTGLGVYEDPDRIHDIASLMENLPGLFADSIEYYINGDTNYNYNQSFLGDGLTLSSQAIITVDDLEFIGNQSQTVIKPLNIQGIQFNNPIVNTLVAGLTSTRANHNRLKEFVLHRFGGEPLEEIAVAALAEMTMPVEASVMADRLGEPIHNNPSSGTRINSNPAMMFSAILALPDFTRFLFSLLSLGLLMNNTSSNQGDHCIWARGNKLIDKPNQELFCITRTYTINALMGYGGSISPDGDIVVNHGESVTFEITPYDNFIIDDVEVDGESMGPRSSYTFESVKEDYRIVATFESTLRKRADTIGGDD